MPLGALPTVEDTLLPLADIERWLGDAGGAAYYKRHPAATGCYREVAGRCLWGHCLL